MKQEIRQINNNITTTENSRTVEGYAVVFNSQSEDLGFFETIHTGAITTETIENSDVLCKFNHIDDKVLARSKYGQGSLKLEVDDIGLRYSFEAPKTELGNEILEYLKRGDIVSSSFAFTVSDEEGAEKWTKDENGVLHRDIYKIDQLYDVSPVFQPAYEATSVHARAKDKINESKLIDEKMNYYMKLIDEIM